MEVKISLNRRFIFDVLVVIELLLLIVYGIVLISIDHKIGKGTVADSGTGAIPAVAAAPTAPSAAPSAAPTNVKGISAADWVRGDKNSPLTFIEYSDFECPFCKAFHPTVIQAMNDYKGKVKFVYRHFPLSFHQNAEKEAEASECVGSLGGVDKFWSFADKIFERTTSNGTGFALADLPKLAVEVGVNQKSFQDCLDSGKMAQKVQAEETEGESEGVNGTPGSFILNDKTGVATPIEGAEPYATVKAAIDAALKNT